MPYVFPLHLPYFKPLEPKLTVSSVSDLSLSLISQITSPTASASFHSSLPSSHRSNKYISVPEGFHELHNEPKEVWEGLARDVADFVVGHSSGGAGGEVPRVEVTEATGQESAKL